MVGSKLRPVPMGNILQVLVRHRPTRWHRICYQDIPTLNGLVGASPSETKSDSTDSFPGFFPKPARQVRGVLVLELELDDANSRVSLGCSFIR
mmetsp:Transcript_16647/g.34171  ORF Transcript_16647/g.34171 Transcript_16647/m.34171 type:complete len:93 (+) Transcript_16647:707-985(+)